MIVKKTRKDHICRWCEKIIPKGSQAKVWERYPYRKAYIHIGCHD